MWCLPHVLETTKETSVTIDFIGSILMLTTLLMLTMGVCILGTVSAARDFLTLPKQYLEIGNFLGTGCLLVALIIHAIQILFLL